MAKEEGFVVQLEGIIHAFFREDGSLVIMTRRIDSNVWNASYGEEVELSPEGVKNLRRMLGGEATQPPLAPSVLARCEKCNALIETTIHCDNCGTFEPTRQ